MTDITVEQVQRWLDGYVAAWQTYDPIQIGDLFAEDAVYHRNPRSTSAKGREAIVSFWVADKELDMPGLYGGHYVPVAIDGNLALAYGTTEFFDEDGALDTVYRNAWLLRFDDDGRCCEFHESYTGPPGPEVRQPD
jgi:ketosteroid isomerase-like protein